MVWTRFAGDAAPTTTTTAAAEGETGLLEQVKLGESNTRSPIARDSH